MKLRSLAVVALVAVMALVTGCRTAPVYNVDNAPVSTTSGNASMDQVRDAIVQAGVSLGWQMKPVKPGLIIGTLNLRTHMAQVDINYNTQAYSIHYKASNNLKYDGANIHSNYNGWVERLDQAIRARLSPL